MLEKSEVIVAKILAHLLPHGVKPLTFGFDEIGLDKSESSLFIDAVSWLSLEGIIRMDGVTHGGSLIKGVLTAYGFALMGEPFKIGCNRTTVGKAVSDVSNGSAPYSKAGDFFGGLLGGLTKSLGS